MLSKLLPEKGLFLIVQTYYKSLNVLLSFLQVKYLPGFIIRRFQSIGIKVIPFQDIETHAIEHPDQVEYLIKETHRLYYSPACFDYLHFRTSMFKSDQDLTQYVAVLKQVSVIGGSNVILTENKKALYDLKYYNTSTNYRYTDGAILAYQKENCLIQCKSSNMQFDEAIWMSGNFSFSYYHLLYEILVKFHQIERLNLSAHIPLLVDKVTMDVPQYHELIQMLNKDGRKIIPIEKGTSYLVQRLYSISCPNFIPPNYWSIQHVKANDNLFHLDSLTYLRSNLIPFSKPLDFPKRIFLSRRKASGRRPFNETEVFQVLEKYGFVTVFPEDYSVAEQISMFHQADFIAGGSGGAFTNVLFCKAGCKLFCFSNYAFDLSIFTTVATHVQADMLYIVDDTKDLLNVKSIHDSFSIDLIKLDEIVRHWTT
jgi:capsular polysaccharide biosynthesis protein